MVTTAVGGTHTLQWRSTDAAANAESLSRRASTYASATRTPTLRLVYQGPFYNTVSATKSGGSWHYTYQSGSAAYVRFVGTGIDVISSKGAGYGIAKVTVDGGEPSYIDFYAPNSVHQTKVWGVAGLAQGTHLVKIEWTGTKNAASTKPDFGLDAFEVIGTLTTDGSAPVSSASAASGWRSANTTVTLSAVDDETYVARTYYRIGSTTTTYTGPFQVAAEGATTVEYWSVDGAGNVEATQKVVVTIDKTAPVTSSNAPASWSGSSVDVVLSAADGHSGVAETWYALDGGMATQSTGNPVTISAQGTTRSPTGRWIQQATVRLPRPPPFAHGPGRLRRAQQRS